MPDAPPVMSAVLPLRKTDISSYDCSIQYRIYRQGFNDDSRTRTRKPDGTSEECGVPTLFLERGASFATNRAVPDAEGCGGGEATSVSDFVLKGLTGTYRGKEQVFGLV